MDGATIEGLADWTYRAARLDELEPAAPLELARGLGVDVYEAPRGVLRSRGALARVGAEWRIYLRPGLPPGPRRWVLAHELAELVLRHEDYRGEDVEQAAERLGAALLAPRRWAARGGVGLRAWRAMGKAAGMGPAWAALRQAEASGRPTALVRPGIVRARGEAFAWPAEAELHAAAAAPRAPRGLRRVRLPGALALVG